jgi:hypothetical protein
MKALATCLVLVVLLTACSRESKLRHEVVGTWTEYKILENGISIGPPNSSKLTLASDGHYETDAVVIGTNFAHFVFGGTWKVANGNLILTYTNTSHPKLLPIGTMNYAKIIRVDSNELVIGDTISNRISQTIFMKRLK